MNLPEKYSELVSSRGYISDVWVDVERYCQPYKGKYSQDSPYTLYDGTSFRSVKILASGLYSYLTSPASRWFQLDTDAPVSIKKQVSKISELLFVKFRKSNFYQVIDTFYKDLVNYGVALLYEELDDNGDFRFKVINPKSFVFTKSVYGELDTVIISLKMTIGEVVGIFGIKNVSDGIAKKFENNQLNEKVEVLFGVFRDYKGKKPFKSLWVEKETNKTLREGFYDSMPFFLAQWDVPSDSVYGTSPSIDALPSIILANRITKTFWVNNEKMANPPLDVPYDGYMGDIDISPGAINYRMVSDPNNRIVPIITSGNINITIESLQQVRQQIQEKYFVDLFLLTKDTTMTATEVIQRSQEKMLLLGSVIGRLVHDVLRPLIARSILLMTVTGEVQELPNEIKVDFLSPLAQSQKSVEYNTLIMVLNTALQIAQFNQQTLDIINWDTFLRKVGDIYAVDANIFNDPDEVQKMREQQAQLQQTQLQLQLEELKGKAMKQQAQAQLNAKKSEVLGL